MLDKMVLCGILRVEPNKEFKIPVEYDEEFGEVVYNHFVIDPEGLPWIRKGNEVRWSPLISWHWLLTHMDEIER